MVCPNATLPCSTDSTARRDPCALPRSTGTVNFLRPSPKYSPSSARAVSSSAAARVPRACGVPGAGSGGGPHLTLATPASVQATETWPTGVSRQPHASSVTPSIVPGGSDTLLAQGGDPLEPPMAYGPVPSSPRRGLGGVGEAGRPIT